MLLGRVTGTVVATRKDEKLHGKKLLVVKTIDPESGESQGYIVAVDTVGAGAGETVIMVSGSSARMSTGMKDHPVDTAIVGIVDTLDIEKPGGQKKKTKS